MCEDEGLEKESKTVRECCLLPGKNHLPRCCPFFLLAKALGMASIACFFQSWIWMQLHAWRPTLPLCQSHEWRQVRLWP